MRMKKRDAHDLIKLHEALCNPTLEEQYQEVFSFVRTLTDKGLHPNELTADMFEHWNERFDEVLRQLTLQSSKEDNDHMKEGTHEE